LKQRIYMIRVQPSGFYGWPHAYIGKHPMPGFANLAPDKVEASMTPDLLFATRSSLLDLVFYESDQFPAEYKGSLFVALKGSWNRSVPTGYEIVRVPFKDGRAEGWYENFATGFWASANSAPRSGAAPPPSLWPRTARCSSPTTPAARSGASPTTARLRPNTPPRR
jgi:glucose/arabinose dehydrogenase